MNKTKSKITTNINTGIVRLPQFDARKHWSLQPKCTTGIAQISVLKGRGKLTGVERNHQFNFVHRAQAKFQKRESKCKVKKPGFRLTIKHWGSTRNDSHQHPVHTRWSEREQLQQLDTPGCGRQWDTGELHEGHHKGKMLIQTRNMEERSPKREQKQTSSKLIQAAMFIPAVWLDVRKIWGKSN